MTGRGIVDHADLGLLILQHFEPQIEEGRRHLVAAARLLELPNPKRSTDPRNAARKIATEHGMGTIGDVHPWRLWQCESRHKRASGSWAQLFLAVGTEGGTGGFGRNGTGHAVSALELYPVKDSEGRADDRYHREALIWPPNFAAVPRGTMLGALAGTDEKSQQDAALWGDPRLFAPATEGPGECGSLVVDLQPTAEPCMDRTSSPGVGGRAARLQGFLRVVAMPERGGPLERVGASPGNVLAWNGSLSRQDGLPGLGAVWLELTAGGPSGPTTGHPPTPPGPITPGAGAAPPPASPPAASPPPEFQSESAAGGSGTSGGTSSGGTSSGGVAEPKRWRDWGKFEQKPHTRHGLALFAALRSWGPLHAGSGTCQHRIGFDRDGNPIASGHLATSALWYLRDDRDGPLHFQDVEAQRPGPLPLRTRVHLVWDREKYHPWLDGQKRGKWVFEGEAPLVIPDDGDEPPDDPVPDPRPPTTGTPTSPGGPRQPGGGPPGGGPTTGGNPGGGAPPGGGQPNPGRRDMPVYQSGPRNPPGPFNPGTGGAGGGGGPESGGFGDGPSGGAPGGGWTPDGPTGPTTPSTDPNDERPPAPPPDPKITEWLEEQRRRRNRRPKRGPAAREDSPVAGWTKLRDVGETERGDRALFVIHHPMHESFAATSWRPQLWVRGAPHFERAQDTDAPRIRNDEQRRPHVLTSRAWGAQTDGEDWNYAENPRTSRARGGIVSGGMVYAPPHLEGEDLFGVNGAVSPLTSPSSAAVLFAPNVVLAFGLPSLDGGLKAGALQLRRLPSTTRTPLVLEQLDAARAPVELLRAEIDGASGEAVVSLAGAQALRIPRGTIAERPSSITPAAGMLRIASDLEDGVDELELLDGNSNSWRRVFEPEAAIIRARRFTLYEIDGFASVAAQVNPWTQTAVNGGTVAASSTAADLETHPGILRVSSAVAGNAGWRWHFGNANLVCSGLGGTITECIFRVVSTSGFRLIFGFHGETGVALPASGVFCYADGSTFSAYLANAGDRTQSGTTYTLATNKWYRARVRILPSSAGGTFSLSEMSGAPVWEADISDDFPASSIIVNHGLTLGRTTAGVTGMADFDKLTLALVAQRS